MATRFEDGRFRFAVGIEDTFVPQVTLGRRSLDEYELTQHYHYWHEDLGLAASTGARTMRYGIPWYRIEPERGRFAWDWLDRVVDRLEELEIETIVDLVHYGTPLWLDNQFLNADYPARVAEYAAAVAERYRGRLVAFTPLNEPLVNITLCGESGVWPPYLTGDDGYVKVLRAVARGIVETQHAVVEATGGEAAIVHVEAVVGFAGALDAHADAIDFHARRALLVEDLVTGRVDESHDLVPYLVEHGWDDRDLAWFRERPAEPDVMGVNYYPLLSTAEVVAGEALPELRPMMPRPKPTGALEELERAIRTFWERYGRPVFITETSTIGSAEDKVRWLDESVERIMALRAEGVGVAGYTWWPLFDFVEWSYRDGSGPAEDFRVPMGMFDLVPDEVGVLRRVATPVVDRFRRYAEGAGSETAPAPADGRTGKAVGSRAAAER